jgi:hypothetical protein
MTDTLTILTFAVGPDYKRNLSKCLESKVLYANIHGYTYIQGGDSFWDRSRPISWSKVPFLLDTCSKLKDGSLIWMSDADVLITNMTLKLEEHVLPLLPPNKDILMTFDSCGTVNAGNIIVRNTPWLRDFLKRAYTQTQFLYHIWWEQAAFLHLFETNENDRIKLEVTKEHKRFNAYLRGNPNEPLWIPGDFLVHFAGVGDDKKIKELAEACLSGQTPRISM